MLSRVIRIQYDFISKDVFWEFTTFMEVLEIRYIPLEKWREFFSLEEFFSRPLPPQDLFFRGKFTAGKFFLVVGGSGWGRELEGEKLCCRNLHLNTRNNLNPLNRRQVQTNILNFHSRFAFLSILHPGKNNQISDTLPKMELHCFFGLMFKEISILFIHYPGNKMHSWHAVVSESRLRFCEWPSSIGPNAEGPIQPRGFWKFWII